MRQKFGSSQHQENARAQGSVASAGATRDDAEGGRDRRKAAEALASALKGFAATLSKHTERQSNIVDVFGSAIRELTTELQKNKSKVSTLEVRLREAETRIGQLERVIGAWIRQGQGWVQ